MNGDGEEFALGEDVTSLAKSRRRGGTAVLSIRLSLEEFAALEAASQATGKTVSQVVREAIRGYLRSPKYEGPTVKITWADGHTSSSGVQAQWGETTRVVIRRVGEEVA